MTGILLIVGGLIALISGIFLVTKNPSGLFAPNPETGRRSTTGKNSGDLNKEKGDAFEAYVVHKFKFEDDHFKLKDWRSDKYTKGISPESSRHPDLQIDFVDKGSAQEFAVECKWRQNYYQNGIELRSYQLSNYNHFQNDRNIPVFIVFGIGGQPDNPAELFIIPLHDAAKGFLTRTELRPFQKQNIGDPLSYDSERKLLK